MRKILSLCICIILTISALTGGIAFAENPNGEGAVEEIAADAPKQDVETPVESAEVEKIAADAPEQDGETPEESVVSVNLTMLARTLVEDSVAVVELCNSKGESLGTAEEWIGGITERVEFEFAVPELSAGDKFTLRLKSGLVYLQYYDDIYYADEAITLETYGYRDENGEAKIADTFELAACPLYEHAIIVYTEGRKLELYPRARLVEDIAMVPVMPVAQALGIKTMYDEKYNSVVCSVGKSQVIFNLDTAYATEFGTDTYMPRKCERIDGDIYVPARFLADAFGSEIQALDFGDHIDVCIGKSSVVEEYRNKIPVNKWGISSRTGYLVWVSKSDFRVRVYTGSRYNWEEVASFPCAIGAPGTPTITGSFEYQYKMDSWVYPQYYVGPCLVFYGNYALHSTLQRYNGRPYDDRVGVMISHGCVRMHKADIDWLAAHLPLKSRVYVTE